MDSGSAGILSVLIPAVGGQGGGVLSEWIVERCSGGVHDLRRNALGVPAGIESDVPSLAVHDDVMGLAQ